MASSIIKNDEYEIEELKTAVNTKISCVLYTSTTSFTDAYNVERIGEVADTINASPSSYPSGVSVVQLSEGAPALALISRRYNTYWSAFIHRYAGSVSPSFYIVMNYGGDYHIYVYGQN